VAGTFPERQCEATGYSISPRGPKLTRIKTHGWLGPVEWTPELTERAVGLARRATGRRILKLTARRLQPSIT